MGQPTPGAGQAACAVVNAARKKNISCYVGCVRGPSLSKNLDEASSSFINIIHPPKEERKMAATQHIRAAPLSRALRATAAAPPRSRRALLGLSEPELRQLAVDLGQVPN